MKRTFYLLLTLATLILWSSCRKDFDYQPSEGNLSFSKDTVYLDTVFTNIGSSTYNLKVYNQSNNDIFIPTLKLSKGEESHYRLNVDGMSGKEFRNVELLAKDSMYIFVETTLDIQEMVTADKQFLYTDAIEFDSGSHLQKVDLVTLVKDAVFIFPNRDANGVVETLYFDLDGDGINDQTNIQGRFLKNNELNFTNDKPYVIYGYAAVGENKTLTIDAGARIHFHSNSGLLVTNNASLKVNGQYSSNQTALEKEVIFQSDRLEPLFKNIPGQWGTIWLFQGSKENEINYATIKNATIGILSENDPTVKVPKLTIKNSKIYNSSNFGILGRGTSITGENLVINNAGQSAFAGTYGGIYELTHCTITNYWSNSFRQLPALYLNNFLILKDDSMVTNPLISANFNNCIVYGNDTSEFLIEKEDAAEANFKFTNCLIRFEGRNDRYADDPNYDFSNTERFENVVYNKNPDFKNTSANQLNIGEDSAAINLIGNNPFSNQVPKDILNVSRTSAPDVGAYQHISFEK